MAGGETLAGSRDLLEKLTSFCYNAERTPRNGQNNGREGYFWIMCASMGHY